MKLNMEHDWRHELDFEMLEVDNRIRVHIDGNIHMARVYTLFDMLYSFLTADR